MKLNYQSEVDGLRALAIIPVIFYHAGLPYFGGGFIGVDIFFVISGYLITSIIFPKISDGKFSILEFYENRVRRLLPALLFLLLVSTIISIFLLYPDELRNFSLSALSSLFFVSNFFFWKDIDYFEPQADLKPLLHTWSLSIEEQFYIIFPIFLVFLLNYFKKRVFALIAVTMLLSMCFMLYGSLNFTSANFYFPFSRAWELLLGSMTAIYLLRNNFIESKLLPWICIIILFASFYWFSRYPLTPNLQLILPCLAVCGLLISAREHIVYRFLRLKPLVFIGLISYSLYLFHQPIIAFSKHLFLSSSYFYISLSLFLSFLCAVLSWRFIERPFRKQNSDYVTGKKMAIYLGILSLFIASTNILIVKKNGLYEIWENRLNFEQEAAYSHINKAYTLQLKNQKYDNSDCIFNISSITNNEKIRLEDCFQKYGNGIMVFGDSHANNLFNALVRNSNAKFLFGLTDNSCQVFNGLSSCFFGDIKKYNLSNFFQKMIYHQAGFYYLQNEHKRNFERRYILSVGINEDFPFVEINEDLSKKTLANLKDIGSEKIVFLGPRVEPHLPKKLIIQKGCKYDFQLRPNQNKTYGKIDNTLENQAKEAKVTYISLSDILKFNMSEEFINCNNTFWSDGDHWSEQGEIYFGQKLRFLTE